ncbi:MAG: pyridoxamine 5'-phosphate oxidase [Microcystaceae cyanobacterium]
MALSLAELRLNYSKAQLTEDSIADHPFTQFHHWLEDAIAAQLIEPNAMSLATLAPTGKPIARMVLLKALDERGFVFFTNYDSAKGKQLSLDPHCALVFWWAELERQVRIEGTVEKISPEESDYYFQSRPRASQLGAWASPQSEVISDRTLLEQKLVLLDEKYTNQQVPRPDHWGGFRVLPTAIEFWQGRPSRLHDRIYFELNAQGVWQKSRLAP